MTDIFDVLNLIFTPIWDWFFKIEIPIANIPIGIGWLLVGSATMAILVRFLWKFIFHFDVSSNPNVEISNSDNKKE